jgi:hypothetical protein
MPTDVAALQRTQMNLPTGKAAGPLAATRVLKEPLDLTEMPKQI